MLIFRRARLPGAIFVAVVALFSVVARAGPGHDHGGHDAPADTGVRSPRVVAVSESYEFVGILKGGKIIVYLDQRDDTSPVTNARVEMTVSGETGIAEPHADGTYSFSSPVLAKHADHEVIVVIEHEGRSDLLVGLLKTVDQRLHGHAEEQRENSVAVVKTSETPHAMFPGRIGMLAREFGNAPLLVALALGFGVLIGALVRRRTILTLGVIGMIAVPGLGIAWAGPGHAHGEGGLSASLGDAPRRLADGELFLPKPTQRLLALRTRVLVLQTAHRTSRLIGRIIANPNRAGLVQSTIGGRIQTRPEGLPNLGQHVKKGEVLAYVEPAFAPIDASDVRQTAGDLSQRIAVLDARIARQKRLVEKGVVNAASLEDLEIERTGLEARRRQLAKSRSEREALLAPVDGVIAEVRVVAGQVVSSADTLFNILDPGSLWVEAISFDPSFEPARRKAKARTSDGTLFDLTFIGRSRALQQQASVMQFRVDAPTNDLAIGSPVKVLIETGEAVTGIIVPRGAIASAPNGQLVAFKRLEPERYIPVAVRIEDLDGQRVRVTAGVKAGDQIVVEGAPLVNQIR
jgi:RND family efflux transporter MFP subunit